jgi:hypothetical protein
MKTVMHLGCHCKIKEINDLPLTHFRKAQNLALRRRRTLVHPFSPGFRTSANCNRNCPAYYPFDTSEAIQFFAGKDKNRPVPFHASYFSRSTRGAARSTPSAGKFRARCGQSPISGPRLLHGHRPARDTPRLAATKSTVFDWLPKRYPFHALHPCTRPGNYQLPGHSL